eukprot:scaffold136016_cov41-Attheya_sp.AAC.1
MIALVFIGKERLACLRFEYAPHQAAEIKEALRFGWTTSLLDDTRKKLMMLSQRANLGTDTLVAMASEISTLMNNRSINMHNLEITQLEATQEAFSCALETHHRRSFHHLNVINTSIGAEGCIAIASILCRNQSLHVLEMSLDDREEEGVAAITHTLASSQTLHKLTISMSIGLKGERAIISALSKNQSLQILDLRFNSFGDESAVAIACALETNHTLR